MAACGQRTDRAAPVVRRAPRSRARPSRRLTDDTLDLPGALLSIATIGLACYALTSGVEHGWTVLVTIACAVGAVLAATAFVIHENHTAATMLDLRLFRDGTVRGAAIAQVGTSIAMAAVMFGLILHFQYAYGWSPVRAGLANLPMILTMIVATPLSEGLARHFGHRIATAVGAVLSPADSPPWPGPSTTATGQLPPRWS